MNKKSKRLVEKQEFVETMLNLKTAIKKEMMTKKKVWHDFQTENPTKHTFRW